MSEATAASYVLPPALVSRADLSRMVREVEAFDNDIEVQRVRAKEGKTNGDMQLPVMSKSLTDFLAANKLDIANDQVRMQLKEEVKKLKEHAPVIHMAFAVEADPASLGQLMDYIRREIHPQALLSVGLQPALVGGVYMRTPNHVHDFSLRQLLASKRGLIVQELEKAYAG